MKTRTLGSCCRGLFLVAALLVVACSSDAESTDTTAAGGTSSQAGTTSAGSSGSVGAHAGASGKAGGAGSGLAGQGGTAGTAGESGAAGATTQGGSGGSGGQVNHVATTLELAMGADFSCALFPGGRVKCWGQNLSGQLGLGDTENRGDQPGEMGDNLPFIDLGADSRVSSLAVGASHACALLDDSRIKCWGSNVFGQLGLGDTLFRGDEPGQMGDALPTVELGAGLTPIALFSKHQHTCALFSDGRLKCWGLNNTGALGLGDTQDRGDEPGEMGDNLPFVDLGTSARVTTLAVGFEHSCALLEDGRVKCWGVGMFNQLGQDSSLDRGGQPGEMGDALKAVNLGAGDEVTSLVVGDTHSCALLKDGKVKCWGNNAAGQLGVVIQPGHQVPQAVDLGAEALASSLAAGFDDTCALLSQGSVKCWGDNFNGELGLGDTKTRGGQPGDMGDFLPAVDLGTGAEATGIAMGFDHTCAVLQDGRVKCWGVNVAGDLGLGDKAIRGDEPGEMGDNLPAVDLGTPP